MIKMNDAPIYNYQELVIEEMRKELISQDQYIGKLTEAYKEIERLNKEIETLKQPQVFIDTQDMEERYGEELYKEYLENENKKLHSIIKEVKEYIKTTVEIIKEQPSKDFNDDLWILNRLNGFLEILDKAGDEK